MTLLCVSLTERTTAAALAAMRTLPAGVDTVELRLDLMDEFDVDALCAGRDRPVIVTCRAAREGGAWRRPEAERLQVLRHAARAGADFVDVELDAVAALGELPPGTRRICSHHDFERTPDLRPLLRDLRSARTDVAKLAVTAHDAGDCARVLQLLADEAPAGDVIALAMGEEGLATRVLAPKYGAFLTFASQGGGREAAPGQLTAAEMLELYRIHAIGPGTDVYGVIAEPVAHSMSPAVHNAAFAATGIDAVYLPFLVHDPAFFLREMAPFDLRGLSVTIPHKETVYGLMDETDELSRRIGAVNTVLLRDGLLSGRNTDIAAAVDGIRDAARRAGHADLAQCHVLLVGAGGAGRAIATGLRPEVGRMTIANRTRERGERLAADLSAEAIGLDEVGELRPDVLVNSTSVGMWPRVDACPVPAEVLRPGMVVFDSVYNPPRTRLLQLADKRGAATATGLGWFVGQAAAQFEWWTGRPAPLDVMAEALRAGLEGG